MTSFHKSVSTAKKDQAPLYPNSILVGTTWTSPGICELHSKAEVVGHVERFDIGSR